MRFNIGNRQQVKNITHALGLGVGCRLEFPNHCRKDARCKTAAVPPEVLDDVEDAQLVQGVRVDLVDCSHGRLVGVGEDHLHTSGRQVTRTHVRRTERTGPKRCQTKGAG